MVGEAPKNHWDHWYEVVEDDSLRQGDVFKDILSFRLPQDLPVFGADVPDSISAELEWLRGTRIVVTASCDLDARAISQVWVAPVLSATAENLSAQPGKDYDRRLEAMRSDLLPRQFLLSDYPDLDFSLSFVPWDDVLLLPVDYLRAHCTGPRLRLRHPFREKFGNWIGARISAVGPEDEAGIPRGEHRPYEKHLLDAVEELGS